MRILAIGTNGKLVAGGAVSQGSRNIITDIPECGRIEFGEEFSIAEGDIRVERSFANDTSESQSWDWIPLSKCPPVIGTGPPYSLTTFGPIALPLPSTPM